MTGTPAQHGFSSGLFDRLMGERGDAARPGTVTRLTLPQLRDSVARDLEELLNTRIGIADIALAGYPECARSLVSYGLIDFAGMCLSSADDRARICASLKLAIERHEPRLRHIVARLEREGGAINRISFVISGTLDVFPVYEPVNFDAVLQPSTLRYAIAPHTGRAPSA